MAQPGSAHEGTPAGPAELRAPKPILNELSQLAFTIRIIEEAEDPRNPLAERLRFVAIASANLQEYFMTHFARLDRSVSLGPDDAESSTRFRAPQVRRHVAKATNDLRRRLVQVWTALTGPGSALEAEGLALRSLAELSAEQRTTLRQRFDAELASELRAVEQLGAESPRDAQTLPDFAVLAPGRAATLTWVRASPGVPTLLLLESDEPGRPRLLVDSAELIAAELPRHLGRERAHAYALRVVRAADDAPDYGPDQDRLAAIRQALADRKRAAAVRLEIHARASAPVRRRLATALSLPAAELVTLEPFGLARACARVLADRPELGFAPLRPRVPAFLAADGTPFAAIAARDRLLYHPYDSFAALLELLRRAAHDPATRAMAISLYRVGADTPLVEILGAAAERGVDVHALVELRARFDEQTNLEVAKALTARGVHVSHGPPGFKVHAKVFVIERDEADGPRRYVHLGTGNYHHATGHVYSDLSLLSAAPELGDEVHALFAALRAGAELPPFEHLLVAPTQLRDALIERVNAAIAAAKRGLPCRLAFKINALVDDRLINRLYKASKAGVEIALQVRGTCRLRPGVPGLSERIEVLSIVGRFLEHARVYAFEIGDELEVLAGSADGMPRNLDRRVEVLFPIRDPEYRARIVERLLDDAWRDDIKGRRLTSDARYVRASGGSFELQAGLIERALID